jgi:hypothetical protein
MAWPRKSVVVTSSVAPTLFDGGNFYNTAGARVAVAGKITALDITRDHIWLTAWNNNATPPQEEIVWSWTGEDGTIMPDGSTVYRWLVSCNFTINATFNSESRYSLAGFIDPHPGSGNGGTEAFSGVSHLRQIEGKLETYYASNIPVSCNVNGSYKVHTLIIAPDMSEDHSERTFPLNYTFTIPSSWLVDRPFTTYAPWCDSNITWSSRVGGSPSEYFSMGTGGCSIVAASVANVADWDKYGLNTPGFHPSAEYNGNSYTAYFGSSDGHDGGYMFQGPPVYTRGYFDSKNATGAAILMRFHGVAGSTDKIGASGYADTLWDIYQNIANNYGQSWTTDYVLSQPVYSYYDDVENSAADRRADNGSTNFAYVNYRSKWDVHQLSFPGELQWYPFRIRHLASQTVDNFDDSTHQANYKWGVGTYSGGYLSVTGQSDMERDLFEDWREISADPWQWALDNANGTADEKRAASYIQRFGQWYNIKRRVKSTSDICNWSNYRWLKLVCKATGSSGQAQVRLTLTYRRIEVTDDFSPMQLPGADPEDPTVGRQITLSQDDTATVSTDWVDVNSTDTSIYFDLGWLSRQAEWTPPTLGRTVYDSLAHIGTVKVEMKQYDATHTYYLKSLSLVTGKASTSPHVVDENDAAWRWRLYGLQEYADPGLLAAIVDGRNCLLSEYLVGVESQNVWPAFPEQGVWWLTHFDTLEYGDPLQGDRFRLMTEVVEDVWAQGEGFDIERSTGLTTYPVEFPPQYEWACWLHNSITWGNKYGTSSQWCNPRAYVRAHKLDCGPCFPHECYGMWRGYGYFGATVYNSATHWPLAGVELEVGQGLDATPTDTGDGVEDAGPQPPNTTGIRYKTDVNGFFPPESSTVSYPQHGLGIFEAFLDDEYETGGGMSRWPRFSSITLKGTTALDPNDPNSVLPYQDPKTLRNRGVVFFNVKAGVSETPPDEPTISPGFMWQTWHTKQTRQIVTKSPAVQGNPNEQWLRLWQSDEASYTDVPLAVPGDVNSLVICETSEILLANTNGSTIGTYSTKDDGAHVTPIEETQGGKMVSIYMSQHEPGSPLYRVYHAGGTTGHIYFQTSLNHGETWQTQIQVSASVVPLQQPTITGLTNDLLVSFYEQSGQTVTLKLRRSTDGGTTWADA